MEAAKPSLDALMPQEIAEKAEQVGIRKATAPLLNVFLLAILAGAYIAVGAFFATTVSAGMKDVWPYGFIRLLMGLAFCSGLIMVVLGGAELFTGNNLIIMAWASRKINTAQLLRNWLVVYSGNFVGSVATAVIIFISRQYTFGGGTVGGTMLGIAISKTNLGFFQAVALGILCNALVCMAVWLTYGARTTTDKIAAIIFPITAFVAAGFEHSVANMYFIPIALLIKDFDPAFALKAATSAHLTLDGLTWAAFFIKNLLPVTIGNIIGGAGMVGFIYWFIYSRNKPR